MAVIRVPAPTPQSFDKHAPISELLKAQITHFREVEMRLPHAQHSGIRDRDIATEADAAQYIAYVTGVLHGRRPPKPVLSRRPSPVVAMPARPQAGGLAIAAVSAPDVPAPAEPEETAVRKTPPEKPRKAKATKQSKKRTRKQTEKRS